MPPRIRQIAIAGNVIAKVGEVEQQLAEAAVRDLGRELAVAGYHIVAYSSTPQFADPHMVSGYIASQLAKPSSIHIKYPSDEPSISFAERQAHSALFDMQPDSSSNWEVSFYDSLGQVDGILMIGGGRSTLVAGLVGMGYGTVVLPIPSFGGYSQRIWSDLKAKGKDSVLTADDLSILASPDWGPDTAKKIISLFEVCFARLEERETERQVALAKAAKATMRQALLAVLLFLLCASLILAAVTSHAFSPTVLTLILALGAPCAGIAGATIRTLNELNQKRILENAQPAYLRAALGRWPVYFQRCYWQYLKSPMEPACPPESRSLQPKPRSCKETVSEMPFPRRSLPRLSAAFC